MKKSVLFLIYAASLPLEVTRVCSVVVRVLYGASVADPDLLGKNFVVVVRADRQTLQHKEALAFRANHPRSTDVVVPVVLTHLALSIITRGYEGQQFGLATLAQSENSPNVGARELLSDR